ncbi:uncharacterized protein [Montipora foliosa]|uniref:uncharacterized protein isoform X2 n=1 Tax=Montipora foliosa TaxID=591990 RepID=UPI0035F153A6
MHCLFVGTSWRIKARPQMDYLTRWDNMVVMAVQFIRQSANTDTMIGNQPNSETPSSTTDDQNQRRAKGRFRETKKDVYVSPLLTNARENTKEEEHSQEQFNMECSFSSDEDTDLATDSSFSANIDRIVDSL